MLEKYKLCPCCGKKNYPGLIECIDCEQDLTQVAITDSAAEKSADGSTDKGLVRVCDACFAKNPPNARKCLLCGEDIADILPMPDTTAEAFEGVSTPVIRVISETPETPETPEMPETPVISEAADTSEVIAPSETPPSDKPSDTALVTVVNTELAALPFTVILTSDDGSFSYTLTSERTVLGRSEAASEYLAAKPYVSRVHCAITVTGEGVFLEDLNNTNYSFVNNTRATGRVKLENGDSLSLGGLLVGGKRQLSAAYFTVKVI